MGKNVISQSDELIRINKKMKRSNFLQTVLISFSVLFLFLLYVFLVVLAKGNYCSLGTNVYLESLSFLPYFDISTRFDDFSSIDTILRYVTLVSVLIVASLAGVIYYFLHLKKVNRIYKEKYMKYLSAETKINGIVLSNQEQNQDVSQELDAMNISLPSKEKEYQVSTPLLCWSGTQYTYSYLNERRDGFLVQTTLSKVKSHGLVQLRTYGSPSIKQYQGLSITKYGFGEDNKISNFVCYTSLGNEIYLMINSKVADALCNLKNFVRSDIIINIIGEKVMIFIDGFRMSLTKNIKEKLKPDILEKQAEAIVAFHQVINELVVAFSGEITFEKEQKGNGILDY